MPLWSPERGEGEWVGNSSVLFCLFIKLLLLPESHQICLQSLWVLSSLLLDGQVVQTWHMPRLGPHPQIPS